MAQANNHNGSQKPGVDLSKKTAAILMAIISLIVFVVILSNYLSSSVPQLEFSVEHIPSALGGAFISITGGVIAFIAAVKTPIPRIVMLLSAAATAVAWIIYNSSGFKSGSYDECMVETMKNQNAAMYEHAANICEYRYPYEKELDRFSIDLSWVMAQNELVLSVSENPTKYEVTRAKVIFSNKTCDESTIDDFKFEKQFVFKGKTLVSIFANQSENYECMRTQVIWGKKVRM